jgi:tetratricopeptide (TPR) repeat protein
MSVSFRGAFAQILFSNSETIAGMGFVVSSGTKPIVLTTSGVLLQALGSTANLANLNVHLVRLKIPNYSDTFVEARVLALFDTRNSEISDLAVLQVLRDLPQPTPSMRKISKSIEIGYSFRTLGFRNNGDPSGYTIEGQFQGKLLNGQLQAISYDNTAILRDLVIEGSPAFDDSISSFIGMVSKVTRQENIYTYFITPISTLSLAYPDLVFEVGDNEESLRLQDVFISYGTIDGQEFVERLHDELESKGVSVWLDRRDIREGYEWRSEIDQALRNARAILVVLTDASVLSSEVRAEWTDGLSRYLPVIPLLLLDCEIPLRLQTIQYVDFRHNHEQALAELMLRLENLDKEYPQYLQSLLVDHLQAQSKSNNKQGFEYKINKIREALRDWGTRVQKQEQQAILQHQRIASELNTEIEQRRQEVSTATPTVEEASSRSIGGERLKDISAYFRDRIDQRKELMRLIADPNTRLVSVVGRGGMGKTALVSKVLRDIETNNWADNITSNIDGICYFSTRTKGITLERIFLDIAEMLGGDAGERILKAWVDPKMLLSDKVHRMFDELRKGIYILLFDNVEDLLDSNQKIADIQLREAFEISVQSPHNSSILVTTREPINLTTEVVIFDKRIYLDEGLPEADAVDMLRDLDPNSEFGLRDAPYDTLLTAVRLVHGVPRALEIIASILAHDPFTSIEELLSLEHLFHHREFVEALVRENYRRLDQDGRYVLEALSVFKRPVSRNAIDFVLEPFVPGIAINDVINRLIVTHTLSHDRQSKTISLHPIDRDFIYSQLPEQTQTDDQDLYSRTKLHMRAAEYYRNLMNDTSRNEWTSLNSIEPKLIEFEHLLLASDYVHAANLLEDIDLQLPPKTSFLFGIGHVERAQLMREQLRDKPLNPYMQWINLYQLGLAHTRLGNLEKAEVAHQQGLKIAELLGDTEKQGISLVYLGLVYYHLQLFEQAIQTYQIAIPLTRGTAIEGNNLGHLGNAYAGLGQLQEAIPPLEHAVALNRQIDDKRSLSFWLGRLGDVFRRLSRQHFEKATRYVEDGIAISGEIGDNQVQVYHLRSLAAIYSQFGQDVKGIETYERALMAAQTIGDRWNEALISWELGLLYEEKDTARAIILMSHLLEYEREHKLPDIAIHEKKFSEVQQKLK